MLVRLSRPHPSRADGSYEGPTGAWRVGDVREVDASAGASLAADFPGVFVADLVPDVVDAVLDGLDVRTGPRIPPATTAMRQPPPRPLPASHRARRG